jgi:pimeloyl-ACP methyl ester carboxylesterase
MTASSPLSPRIVVLPGLHGTDELAGPLLEEIPDSFRPLVIQYPTTGPQTYDALLEIVTGVIPRDEPLILIAESFGGPLAIQYSSANPQHVRGMVLSASFIKSPMPRWMGWLPLQALFSIGQPLWAIRPFLTNGGSDQLLPRQIQQVGERLPASVIASRIREVLKLDCGAILANYRGPLLYIRGTRDRLVWRRSLQRIMGVRPDVSAMEIAAPHLILQTNARDAWNVIADFIDHIAAT